MFVALTGGIGCGKSAALQAFADLGLAVADADKICHKYYETTSGIDEIMQRWPSVIDANGQLDRQKLGNIVFRDEEALKVLESLIAPFLHEELMKIKNKEIITIVEIPLLFEKGLNSWCDKSIAVWSPFALRRQRLAMRNWDHNECCRRERLQWTPEQKLYAADYGIINTGSLEMLRKQCELIACKLKNI